MDLRDIEGAVEQTAPIPIEDGPPEFEIPTPGKVPTADELVAMIRGRGGRIHRMKNVEMVFMLTDSRELANELARMGANYKSLFSDGGPAGYLKARDATKLEWDLWIHQIPVSGEKTIWEAAAP